jgi:cold shock CspA family protein
MQIGRAKGPPTAATGARATGKIIRLLMGQTCGFIRLSDRREVFFHRSDVEEDTPFNSLEIGERVAFELIVDAISGPRAVRVTRRLL